MSDAHAALAGCTPAAIKLWNAIAAGHREYPDLAKATGLARATLYAARVELRDAGLIPEPDEAQRAAVITARLPTLPPERTRDPAWLRRLRRHVESTSRRTPRAMLEDVYAPTFDEVAGRHLDGQCAALVVHYAELVEGAPLAWADREEIAGLVAEYGRWALWGVRDGIVVGSEDAGASRWRYARVVAARVAAENEGCSA